MSGSHATLNALAGLSVLPADLQRACAIVREEIGDHRSVVAAGWLSFARACGQRDEAIDDNNRVRDPLRDADERVVFVASDLAWVLAKVAAPEPPGVPPTRETSELEFGLVMPSGVLGRNPSPADPTMQLWQNGYTPVTVHRVPVDTGVGIVEVVAATVRPTPPQP